MVDEDYNPDDELCYVESEDPDSQYERLRDLDSEQLEEDVKRLLSNANGLFYFSNNPERIVKGVINTLLRETKLKVHLSEFNGIQEVVAIDKDE